jgi:hypothetical protein
MTISLLIIEDEPTPEIPKPKSIKHRALVETSELSSIRESDLKQIELEVNVYELNDACE